MRRRLRTSFLSSLSLTFTNESQRQPTILRAAITRVSSVGPCRARGANRETLKPAVEEHGSVWENAYGKYVWFDKVGIWSVCSSCKTCGVTRLCIHTQNLPLINWSINFIKHQKDFYLASNKYNVRYFVTFYNLHLKAIIAFANRLSFFITMAKKI